MIRALLAASLLVLPSAAVACQCDDPADLSAAQREERALFYAGRSLILAEVERIDRGTTLFEPLRYRVIRPLSGAVPKVEILIYPRLTQLPDGSWIGSPGNSCEYFGTRGVRKVMAFTSGRPPNEPALCSAFARANDSGLMPASMCVQYFLDDPEMVRRILEIQAGVSRSSRPPSSSR
ncbi:hypothetical protein ACFQPG_08030 [Sphingomonas sp. GCM10030256]|uniref:hypothetical protein n=1 Tax=Sphingomonas sp. GCM10030256 TaxID=3273427 RepID=UPI00361005BB